MLRSSLVLHFLLFFHCLRQKERLTLYWAKDRLDMKGEQVMKD